MKYFFKLIRYQNLIMLAFMQIIVRYGFLKLQNLELALTDFQFVCLVFATVMIAGAGYVINDIFDQDTDLVNKPNQIIIGKHFSENKGYNIYVTMNILGVVSGFYLSNAIEKPSFAAIFIVIAATLYVYASGMKQSFLVGNFLVALLTAFSVIIIAIFDIYPVLNIDNQPLFATFFKLLLDYALFAFSINFIREMVKDLEDFKGDYQQDMKTVPIVLGFSKTIKIIISLTVVFVAVLLYYVYEFYFKNALYLSTIYALVFVIAPLIYFATSIFTAKTTKDFHFLSNLLKLIMFFGILSIYIITQNINHNAK